MAPWRRQMHDSDVTDVTLLYLECSSSYVSADMERASFCFRRDAMPQHATCRLLTLISLPQSSTKSYDHIGTTTDHPHASIGTEFLFSCVRTEFLPC